MNESENCTHNTVHIVTCISLCFSLEYNVVTKLQKYLSIFQLLISYSVGEAKLNEYWAFVQWYCKGNPDILGETSFLATLCPTQTPYGQSWYWNRSSTARSRQLTAWSTARPFCYSSFFHKTFNLLYFSSCPLVLLPFTSWSLIFWFSLSLTASIV